jgi:hypothetical protein
VLAAAGCAAAGGGTAAGASRVAQATHAIVLSDESTTTTWAYAARRGAIFADPGTGRRLGFLHLYTEIGFPMVYVALRELIDRDGRDWIDVRIAARPNGRTGWVRRSALGAFHRSHWLLVVDRRAERLNAYRWGRLRLTAPVGVGKPSTPTPAGHFWITEEFPIGRSSPEWPAAMGTSAYSSLTDWPGGGVVGIHGWYQPSVIPGDPSHGCIRMHSADISWLVNHVPVGTPLHII